MTQSVNLRAEIDDYTNRVLGVVKEKFGLRDKSEALNKFAEMYGEEFVEREVREEFIVDVLKSLVEHKRKHPDRRMTLAELDKLSGV